jgi:AraC family transcriptional regulator
MPVQDSRSEYAARMHRVLEFIDRYLDESLELDALASVANFSAYHFARRRTYGAGSRSAIVIRSTATTIKPWARRVEML